MRVISKGETITFNCDGCHSKFIAGFYETKEVEKSEGNYYTRCPVCGHECYSNVVEQTALMRDALHPKG